ncbi:N-acetylmuramoyl-L-alanine amidase [Streptomyces sp. NPDC060194]|uniref:N-acetylmuramoyl-L-alanine amidase n=1 Tax=Streptomyces sp. NPDC060194 TaxID=3347069 RepID=UPI003667583C
MPLRSAAAVGSAALLFSLIAAVPSATAEVPESGRLQEAFASAADRYDVPQSVLLGVSYLQSRWDGHGGAASVTGGYGPMHLTDAVTAIAEAPHHSDDSEDARGDSSRAPRHGAHADLPEASELPARLRTMDRAAELTGLSSAELRHNPAANVAGGAALLADAQKKLGRPASDDPADWYGAVAAYSGADDAATAAVYADDVFSVIREGDARTTDSGQQVRLAAVPGLEADARQVRALGLKSTGEDEVECPSTVACEWIPSPYQDLGGGDYGNHDKGDRPVSQSVDYIVVHDTEATWDVTLKLVQDPTYVSWHYSLRASDGHIAQHLRTKDVGWHAGNWFVNSKSVGLEHEGFLANPDAWYTEAMYQTSARLVRYLAEKYDVPLDRQHIIGHDNVPGTTTATIRGMHTDPGPYWDWAHYFDLIGAPFKKQGGSKADVVTVRPDYQEYKPVYTGCAKSGNGVACAPHGSGSVRLHTEPRSDAPLVKDIGLRPTGADSTNDVYDTGARASTGQQFAVAERQGDWTAIWYLGQKAWFENPRKQPTAVSARELTITPKEGLAEVPVYGRAYPEASAYPAGVPVQAVSPLVYKLPAGQRYVTGGKVPGEYYYSATFDTAGQKVVRGTEEYYEIQFGHRVAFVKAADVTVVR